MEMSKGVYHYLLRLLLSGPSGRTSGYLVSYASFLTLLPDPLSSMGHLVLWGPEIQMGLGGSGGALVQMTFRLRSPLRFTMFPIIKTRHQAPFSLLPFGLPWESDERDLGLDSNETLLRKKINFG